MGRLASVSLVIVIVFIISHSIKWIINGWEVMQLHKFQGDPMWPRWIEIITHVSHVATTFNSSANFFIYLAKHPDILFDQQQNNLYINEAEDNLIPMRKSSEEMVFQGPRNEMFSSYNTIASSASCSTCTTNFVVEQDQDMTRLHEQR